MRTNKLLLSVAVTVNERLMKSLYPKLFTSTSYLRPDFRLSTAKLPFLSLRVCNVSLAPVWLTATVEPATGSPLSSRTIPVILADCCANAGVVRNASPTHTAHLNHFVLFFIVSFFCATGFPPPQGRRLPLMITVALQLFFYDDMIAFFGKRQLIHVADHF